MAAADEVFECLIRQLRSVEIDGENFFVVEGDILMTEEELRAVSEKQLRFYLACQRAAEAAQQHVMHTDNNEDKLENGTEEA